MPLACTVRAPLSVTAVLYGGMAASRLACQVQAGFDVRAVLLGETLYAGMGCHAVFHMASSRPRLYGEHVTLPEPYLGDEDWTPLEPDISDLHGLSIKLAGAELQRARIHSLEIDLTDRGGPETAIMTIHHDSRSLPIAMLRNLTCTYKGQRLFKGRLEGRTRDLGKGMSSTLTFKGTLRKLEDHAAFRTCYVDSDLEHWRLDQAGDTLGGQSSADGGYDIRRDAAGIHLSTQWGGMYFSNVGLETIDDDYFPMPHGRPGSPGRIYWELYDGIPEEDPHYIRLIEFEVLTGGWAACWWSYHQVSVYGRHTLNGANIVCPWRFPVRRYGPDVQGVDPQSWPMWHKWPRRSLYFSPDQRIRCIVLRIEAIVTYEEPDLWGPDESIRRFRDQAGQEDPPPHGVIVKSARVFGQKPKRYRDGRAVILVSDAIKDILAGRGFKTTGLNTGRAKTLAADQLYWNELPKDRREALDEANAMLGFDYFAWSDDTVTFQAPGAGPLKKIDITDPRVTLGLSEDIDQTYSGVRVQYTNRLGRVREVIVKRRSAALGKLLRATTISAPDSIKTARSARQVGQRWLKDHSDTTHSDRVVLRGIVPGFGDCLLARPGWRVTLVGARGAAKKLKVTGVRLRPLEWEAELSFDIEPWKFERWLAANAAKAYTVRR